MKTLALMPSYRRAMILTACLGAGPLLMASRVWAQNTPPAASLPKVTLPADPTTWRGGEPLLNDLAFDLSRPEVLQASPADLEDLLRRDLLKLMLDPANREKLLTLALQDRSQSAERWIGYGLAAAGDARAIPLLEEVLANTEKPITTKSKVVDLTYVLLFLSSYYERKGDLVTAAQTQLRAFDYVKGFMPKDGPTDKVPVEGLMANQLLEAARLYRQSGDAEKAKQLYTQVASYGYGWASGIALYDQATELMAAGKHDEARKFLQQPIEGKYADQMNVLLAVALGDSYYRTGEFDQARKYSQQALDDFKALDKATMQPGVEALTNTAQSRLNWIDKWKKSPLICVPEALRLQVPASGTLSSNLSVDTLMDVPVTVTCDDARVKVGPVGPGVQAVVSVYKRVKITVTLPTTEPQKNFDTTLLVSSPKFPDASLRVPMHVEVTAK